MKDILIRRMIRWGWTSLKGMRASKKVKVDSSYTTKEFSMRKTKYEKSRSSFLQRSLKKQ